MTYMSNAVLNVAYNQTFRGHQLPQINLKMVLEWSMWL